MEKKKADLESLIDDSITFIVAEQYAEQGFEILKDYMCDMGEKKLMYKLLSDMDIIYSNIEKDLPKEHVGYEFDNEESDMLMAADNGGNNLVHSGLDMSTEIRKLKVSLNLPGTALLYCFDNNIKTVQDLVSFYQKNHCLPKENTQKRETIEALKKILIKAGVIREE